VPLTDTSVFDSKCMYVMNGAQVGYVAADRIMTVQNSLTEPATATWSVIFSGAKGATYVAQDNYANSTYYGPAATLSLIYKCP